MNLPEASARCRISSAISKTRSGLAVLCTTNWIGRPPPVPGNVWRREEERLHPGDIGVDDPLKLLLDLRLAARPLVPRLERPDGEGLVERRLPGDLEARRKLRRVARQPVHLVGIELDVVGRRVARAVDDREQRSLILLGRELGRGVHDQEDRRCQHRGGDHQGHGRYFSVEASRRRYQAATRWKVRSMKPCRRPLPSAQEAAPTSSARW